MRGGVDPELLPLLDILTTKELNDAALIDMRASRFRAPLPKGSGRVERRLIPGAADAPLVPVLVYQPIGARSAVGAILHVHGGGYISGAADDWGESHSALANSLGCVVVSVDYRLAPEVTFPSAIEDCYAALDWLFSSADVLGVDRKRIGVMGESAGGGLAAALALMARDRGHHSLAFQILIYPMLDDRTGAVEQPDTVFGHHVWTAQNNRYAWAAMLGGSAPNAYAAAARADDLCGLPPTYLYTAALDLFLPENLDYAARLCAAGVPTEVHVYPGAFHGFELSETAQVARRARRDLMAALSRHVG